MKPVSKEVASLLDMGWRLGVVALRNDWGWDFCKWAMVRLNVPQKDRCIVRKAFFWAIKKGE